MDHLASEQLTIRGGMYVADDEVEDDIRRSSVEEEAKELQDLFAQMNQGNLQLEARPGLPGDVTESVRKRVAAPKLDTGLNLIKLPIVSSEESMKLRQKLVEKPPGGLHQRAWREITTPGGDYLRKSVAAWIYRVFPILSWLPQVTKSSLYADIMAGVTVGVMLIPQSMSYADIAGLQYKYGMYAGFLPVMIYALMGTSRQLAVGPVAMVSLLVNAGLDGMLTEKQCPAMYCPSQDDAATCYPSAYPDLRAPGKAPTGVPYECGGEYAKLAFLLSFLVGVIQLGAGILRAGYLVTFLSHPVVSGFTSGAAVIIGLSQVKYIVGFDIPKSQYVYITLGNLFKDLGQTEWLNCLLGLLWLFTLIFFKKGFQRYPQNRFFKAMKPLGPLTMCALGIGLMYAAPGLEKKYHVKVVGKIPKGMSDLWSAGDFDFGQLPRLVGASVSISIIGFMESISIAKSLAYQHGYVLVPGQELVALGAANLVGSCFSAYPVTGSFSRSAVNNSTGAETALSGMVTGLLMLLTITCITPALTNLPKFCLGAMIISSVMNLFSYKEAMHLWVVKKSDFASWLVAFLGTIFLGVQLGLILAVALSLMVVIYESVTPQMSILWSIPHTKYYRHVKQPEPGNFIHGVLTVRIGASMYFANVANIQAKLESMVREMSNSKAIGEVKYIVLDMTPVVTIDASAIHAMEDAHKEWKKKGVQLVFANCGTRVQRTMSFARFQETIGMQWFLPEVHLAVKFCVKHATTKSEVLRKFSKDGIIPTPYKTSGLGDEDGIMTEMEMETEVEMGMARQLSPEFDLEAGIPDKRVASAGRASANAPAVSAADLEDRLGSAY